MAGLSGRYCYFDTETTGHDPWGSLDRVVQAAVLEVVDDEVVGTLDMLLDPGREIPAEVVPIHGITNEMVNGQPAFFEVVPALLAVMRSALVVIHNAPFDLAFLDQAMVEGGLPPEQLWIVDTLQIARRHCTFPGNALRRIALNYGVETPEPHQALTDVIILRQVTEAMLGDLGVDSPEKLRELQGVYPRLCGLAPVLPPFWAAAIEEERQVRVVYSSASGTRERLLIPRRYLRRYGQEYLEAYCLSAGRELTFRLDRLTIPEDE